MLYLKRAIDKVREEGFHSLLHSVYWLTITRITGLSKFIVYSITDPICYQKSISLLQDRQSKESTLGDILDTSFLYTGWGFYKSIQPQQFRSELRELAEEVEARSPETVMEIGTAEGGTLYLWSRFLKPNNLISVDLPGGIHGGGYPRKKSNFYRNFSDCNMTLIRDNSHNESVMRKVEKSIPNDGIDFLLIDGDHRYEGVKKDWQLYKDLVKSGGIIAFHDIVEHPYHPDSEVDEFWVEIKKDYETKEFIAEPDQHWGGIGVVYI